MSSRKRVREPPTPEITTVRTIDDLIRMGKELPPPPPPKRPRRAEDPMSKRLRALVGPLEKLRDMVGLEEVKQSIMSQLLYFLQDLHDGKLDMLHTVIQGPPGVGKTELAMILGEIYSSIGVLRSSRVVTARRSDLIGKYLGHTADRTQHMIDRAYGGVLLIDEAYSLGNAGEGDSFSKECLDTLNQNLTEGKDNFMCIIAGYEDALRDCFFSGNEGLRRRFTVAYTLNPYTPADLFAILGRMVRKTGWSLADDVKPFDSVKEFPNSAGDMESLLIHIKFAHAVRIITDPAATKRLITNKDVQEGLVRLRKVRKSEPATTTHMSMYL